MSYDISFRVKVEGLDIYVPVGDCDANITWNVRDIIRLSTGLPWVNEAGNGLCKDVIPQIEKGLAELRSYPEKYKPYESPNGWGTIGGTAHFFQDILDAWHSLQTYSGEAIANAAVFWIS